MTDIPDKTDAIARAICAEQCAHYGEPPCWKIDPYDWPNEHCCEPGCQALAAAVVARQAEKDKAP